MTIGLLQANRGANPAKTQMLYVWVADTVSRQPEQYMVYILRENM